jgi:hypothetical protein
MKSKIKFMLSWMVVTGVLASAYAGKNESALGPLQIAYEALVDGSGKPVQRKLADKEYTFVYFASHRSEACRNFTAKLLEFYKANKDAASIEILFVSLDNSEKEMQEHLQAMKLPFPAVVYGQIAKSGLLKWAGQESPSLVMLDKEGNLVADCYEGKKYIGPAKVFEKFSEIMSHVGYD